MHHSEALERLKQGNERFVSGLRSIEALSAHPNRRIELAEGGQTPFAMILSCADSRVPAEMVFDCGLGDLFVVRVAGNIVAPSLIGSLEFAAANFGTALCVVMGHSQCGAISASVSSVLDNARPDSDNIQQIVLEVEPSVRKAIDEHGRHQRSALVDSCIHFNVNRSVESLTKRSRVLSNLVDSGKLQIVGAVYDLRSGAVQFMDHDARKENRKMNGKGPIVDAPASQPYT